MNPPVRLRTASMTAAALLVLCSSGVLAGPRLSVEPERLDFGQIDRGGKGAKTLRVVNTGDSALTIEDVRPSCTECMVKDMELRPLAPGQGMDLQITFLAVDVPGKHTAHITLRSNDETEALRRVYLDVEIKAVATPRLIIEPEQLDLGVVMAGQPVRTAVVLHNVGEAPLLIRDFTFGPGVALDGEGPERIAPDQKQPLKLTLAPPKPGVLRSHVTLVTNQPDQRVATAAINGYAARPEQVERVLGGTLVRIAADRGAVEVVNCTAAVAWVRTGDTEKLIAPRQRARVPVAEARAGDRVRITVELPLPDDSVERNGP
jgi:hypothetical protein